MPGLMVADAKPSDLQRTGVIMMVGFEPSTAATEMCQLATIRFRQDARRDRFADFDMSRMLFSIARSIALYGAGV